MLMVGCLCRNEGEWDQELRKLCWRVAELRFGVQKCKYSQRVAYKAWELFKVVNGRPYSE